ncbi:nitrogen fixation protein NifQ [Sulfurospirillum arcachonense]|uniref:nitrogen fixation protein NifQ n=1 Tax=Sulfurospirillum arcachonense TaxID=57666 RepID=UPI0004690603|nr:nitrogen fixation protein NifQ [Sulfurospirillum arcachonense]
MEKVIDTTELNILQDKVTLFLQRYAKDEKALHEVAPRLAEVSLEMNHLYEDLGLKSREQMRGYMQKHFPILHKRKPKNMLWKKFIFESIGESVPCCSSCENQDNCWACRL